MGETLATKATPMLLKVGETVNQDVLPALERFGGWLDENRYSFALAFIDMGKAATGLVKTFGPAMKFIVDMSLGTTAAVIQGAAKIDNALGGKLGLQKHADNFEKFAAGVSSSFDVAITKANQWDTALDKTRKEVEIKADIQDLEKKLATARTQLADKNLTKERRAQLRATISDLESKLNTAHTKLDAAWVTRARVAKLQADKTNLDSKLKTAKQQLADPKLTATKRAKLTADIKELQARRKAAQEEIDALHGKTVTIDMRFTSAGVNLSAHVKKESRAVGGPIKGPGTGTSDTAGLYALSNDEHVVTAREVHGAGGHRAIEAMRRRWARGLATGGRAGGATITSRFGGAAERGAERIGQLFGPYGRALGWARSQAGKDYLMGGVGPGAYDCSGFMSGITNIIRGRSPHSRLGSTATFPWGGFSRGSGMFSIGSVRGNPGHMAGTLLGVNVESRGGEGVVIGPRARGAANGLFGGNVWRLGRLAGGGRAGDAPFDLLDPRGRAFGGRRRVRGFASGGRVRSGFTSGWSNRLWSPLPSYYHHELPQFTPPNYHHELPQVRQAGFSALETRYGQLQQMKPRPRPKPRRRTNTGSSTDSSDSGGGTTVQVVFEILPGGSGLDALFITWLRKAVKVRGGNVQLVLGRGPL